MSKPLSPQQILAQETIKPQPEELPQPVEQPPEPPQPEPKKPPQFMTPPRPQPPSKIKEEGSAVVAKNLSPQMGTAPKFQQEMEIDELKFAVNDDTTLPALIHFGYRSEVDGVRYWGYIYDRWLRGSQGIGGLCRNHVIKLHAATAGGQNIESAKKPNVVARNIWNRDWKENAEAKGEIVNE